MRLDFLHKGSILDKLYEVWNLKNNDDKSLGQILTQACAFEEWTNEIWMLTDEKLEKFLDRELSV